MANPRPPQPGAQIDVDKLPVDVVVLTAWTKDTPQPIQAAITRESWSDFCNIIGEAGGIEEDYTYEFVGPPSPQGRKTRFFVHGLTRVSGNYHSGIVPVKG